nr:hypothetical protein [Tanacetum cinerariifolium]
MSSTTLFELEDTSAEAEAGEDTEAAQRAIEQECLPWECSWGDGGYCNVKPKIQYLAAIQLGLKGDTKKQSYDSICEKKVLTPIEYM